MRLRTLTELSLLTLLRLEEMVMPPEMKFSRRELEILKWTAEGKTSAEVAMILYLRKYRQFPSEEYAAKIQRAKQNANCLLCRGDGLNLIACVVLRARRKTGC
jgi:hypothetical protein